MNILQVKKQSIIPKFVIKKSQKSMKPKNIEDKENSI
jgi:hypothetical protein